MSYVLFWIVFSIACLWFGCSFFIDISPDKRLAFWAQMTSLVALTACAHYLGI